MSRRGFALACVFAMLALPAIAVLFGAATHYFENRTTGTIVTSGYTRPYIVHVPARYDPAKPTPLVLSMHGAMNWPAFQMRLSGWNRVSDEEGFIVAYPAGEGSGLGIFSLRGARTPARMPDVVYISSLIDTLQSRYNIDPARIYANGVSNGGGMSFALSCTLSHRIAAVGLVAPAITLPSAWCTDPKPVPMILFHGTADTATPYRGGKVWFAPEPFPDIPSFVEGWSRRNRCANAVETAATANVSKREYVGCANDASVTMYTIANGGHTWPGGLQLPEWILGTTCRDIDATRLMWKFYQEHPLR